VMPFEFLRAEDVAGAVAVVAEHPDAVYLAGGTNLVDRMKLGVATPNLVVDISHLPLHQIVELPDGTVRIGAVVRNSDLAANLLIRQRYPVLSQALLAGASGQLRNLATTAGNLLQRTRCVYFQDVSMPCNKRVPGSGCSAREGYTRYHAILGASAGCVAVHPSDMAVAMAALDASVVVTGRTGERSIRLTDLHRLPGDAAHQDTVLTHGELITAVDLPRLSFSQHSAYRKVRDRASYAFALISVRLPWNWATAGTPRGSRRFETSGSRSVELLTSLGAPLPPRTSCAARPRVWRTSARLPTSSSPRRRHSTTTHSRSPWSATRSRHCSPISPDARSKL